VRIGIFGGTFNPIHIAHIRSAVSVYETFMLDKIIFVPTGIPPHKKKSVADKVLRYKMVEMAIEGIDFFDISRIEIDKNSINYSIETVQSLKKQYVNDNLFFIVGTDAFYCLDSWKDHINLTKMISFILMRRPEYNLKPIIDKYQNELNFQEVKECKKYEFKKQAVYVHTPEAFDISSSMIRERIKENKNIRYLVPERVENFIKERGMYKI